MNAIALCLILLGTPPDGLLLRIDEHPSQTVVQMTVSFDNQSAAQAWDEFLKHWRQRFDIDHDGQLNTQESGVVPSLQNTANVPVRIDLTTFDTNGDGLLTDDEIVKGYRRRGVYYAHPLPPSIDNEAVQLSDILWRNVDQNHDGLLTADEIAAIRRILNRFDRNEDEQLTASELETSRSPVTWEPDISFTWLPDAGSGLSPIVIPIRLGYSPLKRMASSNNHLVADSNQSDRDDSPISTTAKRSLMDSSDELQIMSRQRLRLSQKNFRLIVNLGDAASDRILAAEKFLLAEIDAVRSDRHAWDIAQLRSDTSVEWLVPLANVIDLDQNGQLDQMEVQTFVNLLAEGAASQVTFSVSLRGRNLFDLLDENANGRLELTELSRADQILKKIAPDSPPFIKRDQIPVSLNIDVKRGPSSGRFARLRIGKRGVEQAASGNAAKKAPRWFEAQDRNRDQQLSPTEFIGPPNRFAELDKNSDGLISSEEAAADETR